MELTLIRTYYEEGTNGSIWNGEELICHSIELPWKDNQHQISCIPEGRYLLQPRFSARFGQHLEVTHVPNRSLILIHPANDAATELRGCIAPVNALTGYGEGLRSRQALQKLLCLVEPICKKESIYLTVKANDHETNTTRSGANALVLQKTA
jgi:Family of unknown function (DUF5675)